MHALRRTLARTWPRYEKLFPVVYSKCCPLSTHKPLEQDEKEGLGTLDPDTSTSKHHDLPSFLAYADRIGLDVTSTVFVGTLYEYKVSSTLAKYGIRAVRVGGVSDHGIDLLGTWKIPSRPVQLKVILQCKGGSQRVGPSLIRELEGSFTGAPVGWRGEGVVAFLVSEKTASKGVRDGMGRSRWPMGFISCSKEGLVRQMLWNQRAEEEGLRGMDVNMRYSEDDNVEPQVVLTYRGKRVRNDSHAN